MDIRKGGQGVIIQLQYRDYNNIRHRLKSKEGTDGPARRRQIHGDEVILKLGELHEATDE